MLKNKVIEQLKTVYDPEMPIDIYELGLIYDISFEDAFPTWNPLKKSTGKTCKILMTLTSAWWPRQYFSKDYWLTSVQLCTILYIGGKV